MEGDYETPFAAALLKWRNRAVLMNRHLVYVIKCFLSV